MSIHNPPFYRYPLWEQWDKEAFEQLKEIGKTKQYPKIIGSPDDKNRFLIALIRTQKALGVSYEEYERRIKSSNEAKIKERHNKNDWRNMLIDILRQVKETNSINAILLNKKYPPESISKNIPAWVTYKDDKIVNDFIDNLGTKKVKFQGTDKEMAEFVLRFILAQLSDWEQSILMIWEMLGNENSINVKQLNEEMKNFDYLGLFE